MYLPPQRKPVQRTLNTQPNADHNATQATPQGVMPSGNGNGVQPSFNFGSLLPVIQGIAGLFS